MKKVIFLLMISIVSLQVFGDDYLEAKKNNYQINGRYKSGQYLIYDCDGSYFACVDVDSYEVCKVSRQGSMDKEDSSYSCAPLKDIGSYYQCVARNYEELNAQTSRRFCYPKIPVSGI